jgi:hypothetical protein
MRAEVYTEDGQTLLRTEERVPECGKDFCDRCGDCLHCYGDDPCISGEEYPAHRWVIYGEPEREGTIH